MNNRLDAALAALPPRGDDPTIATIRGLIIAYDRHWGNQPWRTVEVEQTYHLPIVNPETGRTSRTFTHAGKTDGIIELDGRCYLLEHKTSSEDIADPSSSYWKRLAIDAQVSGYVLSQWQLGRKLAGTVYDVIRKPSIRPKNIAKADRQQIILAGIYCRQNVTETTREALRIGLESENAELFEARLIADIAERPDWYFQRRTIPRLDADLSEYAAELWETADEIRQVRLNGHNYRNPGACMVYNSPCEFLSLCSGHDSPDSDAWKKREAIHSELDLAGVDQSGVLSYSRLQTFRTCRRKHYFRYELGIEPNREEKENLFFGRLFHEALAAWWSFNLGGSNEHSQNAPAAVAVAGQASVADGRNW